MRKISKHAKNLIQNNPDEFVKQAKALGYGKKVKTQRRNVKKDKQVVIK